MKKLLFIALFALIGNITYAQDYVGRIKGPTTLTNATTDTVSVTISKFRRAITFKYDIIKTSGTVAGTIVLQARLTGSDQWATLNTYTLTDATATNSVSLTANQYVNYRVITTTTGTQVSVHNKYLLYRE